MISAAGQGTRLGLNLPKALVEVGDRPLLAHQLGLLSEVDDVVVVAGCRAGLVVELLRELRRDVRVALNHSFATTGTAASLKRGAALAEGWVVSLDGDLLVDANHFAAVLAHPGPCLGVTPARSAAPVWSPRAPDGRVVALSQEPPAAEWEWSGVVKIRAEAARAFGEEHVFPNLVDLLPLPAIEMDCVEIDDLDDLAQARRWVESNGR